MDRHSQLSNAVLQAATLLPTVPDDLARRLATLKARVDQEPSRDPEDLLTAELADLFDPWATEYARQIVAGKEPDTSKLEEALLAALLLSLIGAATTSALQRAGALGVELSIDALNREASRWASTYSYNLVRGINETTRQAISSAVQMYAQTPGMSVDDVARLLQPTFGEARSRMIATTEITRAYSQAAQITQDELQRQGLATQQRWITWRDDRVCPICAPLHNRLDWQAEFAYGPPAHVSCRCWLETVRV